MEQMKTLHVLGVSFQTAPAAVREALAFNRREAASLLCEAVSEILDLEAVVVSTCNRSEFYLALPPGEEVLERWLSILQRTRPEAPILRSECLRYHFKEPRAPRHLFRVACGLESAVLGDVQILGQVKQSLAVAAQCGSLGSTLNRLFSQAIQAGKRARRETDIGSGSASIGSALAGILSQRRRTLPKGKRPEVLIIGAGVVARSIGYHLVKRSLGEITFMNRTDARAKRLAEDHRMFARPWSSLDRALMEADIVIAATSASQPILRRDMLDRLATKRRRPLLVVDAGLPRNVEPGSTVEVLGIDAISESHEEALAQRRAAVPEVEQIVAEELGGWERWRTGLPMEGMIKCLYQEAAALSQNEAQNLVGATMFSQIQAQQILLRSFKRLLHRHVRSLRELDTAKVSGNAATWIPVAGISPLEKS